MGDPHIATPDGGNYTFNGLGEYLLLKVDNAFELQGRTAVVTNEDGSQGKATIWSAFAAQDATGATVYVEMNANKTGKLSLVVLLQ